VKDSDAKNCGRIKLNVKFEDYFNRIINTMMTQKPNRSYCPWTIPHCHSLLKRQHLSKIFSMIF